VRKNKLPGSTGNSHPMGARTTRNIHPSATFFSLEPDAAIIEISPQPPKTNGKNS
jgi:hypothetical protein